MSCGAGCTCSLDLALHRPAATIPIQPLAWEPPYAVGMAVKKTKKKKKNIALLHILLLENGTV